MEALGPRCPACGARVKLPRNVPLPPPTARVKCPSCGSVGELEAFVRAAAGVADSGVGAPPAPEDPPPAETMPNLQVHQAASAPEPGASAEVPSAPAPPLAEEDTGGGTRVSGSASQLSLPPGIRCTLTVLNGPDSGRKLEVTRPRIVVGREAGDLPLSDKEVSREHCAFEITGVTCTVRDLGSRNGTFVDGRRVESEQLANVGEVMVGNTTLLFTMTLKDAVQEG